MKCNVGKTDKLIRSLIVVLFIILGYTVNQLFYLVAVVVLLTVYISFCPLYKLLGINTCESTDKEKDTKEDSEKENTNKEDSEKDNK